MFFALGHSAAGAISNGKNFHDHFVALSKGTLERFWPLSFYDYFLLKNEIADLRNLTGRAAGSLTAAAFLKAFVGDTPWLRLDIAGTAYTDVVNALPRQGPDGDTRLCAFVALAEEIAKPAAVRNGNGAAVAH